MTSHVLPSKIDSYLSTLNHLYERKGETLLRSVIVNGDVIVHEEWDYDNWNGGTYGHAVTFRLPSDIFLDAVDRKNELESALAQDINKLDSTSNEHISAVFLEMVPPLDEHWRKHTDVYRNNTASHSIGDDTLRRIWGEGSVRVFLSHKSNVKIETASLKVDLAKCGIGAFVAHEDIEPTEEWHEEIERALSSMNAMVALLTHDFHDSKWTDQEVGFALGRGVPLIAVRLGSDPYGIMGKRQGLGGCSLSDTRTMAGKIFQLLYKRLPDRDALFQSALSSYKASTSWTESGWRVDNLISVFETLRSDQVESLLAAYHGSAQNRKSFHGQAVLKKLLEKWTGKSWRLNSSDELHPGAL